MSTSISTNSEFQSKLNVLMQMVMVKFCELLEILEVNLEPSGSKYIGCCPIHGGDNSTALNIYYDGHSVPGYWVCRTHNCHLAFGKNIIGFTRGVLSKERLDYSPEYNEGAKLPFMETIHFLADFVGVKFKDIKFDHKRSDRATFVAECQDGSKKYIAAQTGTPRAKVRKNLIIPPQYYLNRGYSAEILDVFDVGIPKKSTKKENLDRVIVPVYGQNELMIGYGARSIFDRCIKCKLFHNSKEKCPEGSYEQGICSKWRNVDFESRFHLYNYYRAKPYIEKSNTVVLVEGFGDVWRLEEAGIFNAVSMFGVNLTSPQQTLLAQAQCMTLVCLLDNDRAGQDACKQIKENYGRLFRIFFPKLTAHDVGDMNMDKITEEIKPLLRSLENL